MIDTVKLVLVEGQYQILNHQLFKRHKHSIGRGVYTLIQNPTSLELKNGIYKPRLTVVNRPHKGKTMKILIIEFSIPKLLFNNNFSELSGSELDEVLRLLSKKLYEMGVLVSSNVLEECRVASIHFSKNIELTDYSTPNFYIKLFSRINTPPKLDLIKTNFTNNGTSIKYHANSYEITFYDKIADLKSSLLSDKRCMEKDGKIQIGLLNSLQNKKPYEVLRYEVRLGTSAKIKNIMQKICYNHINISLKELYSLDISQKVLTYYLSIFEENYFPLYSYENTNIEQFIGDFFIKNPKSNLTTALNMVAMRTLLAEYSFSEIKNIFLKHGNYSHRTISNLKNKIKEVNFFSNPSPFTFIKNKIINYQPLSL